MPLCAWYALMGADHAWVANTLRDVLHPRILIEGGVIGYTSCTNEC